MIAIDQSDGEPRYRQIYRQMAKDIEKGVYRPGDRLPSIRALALELDVSRNTVEQAYMLLAGEGLILTRHGSGHFVEATDHLHPSRKPPAANASQSPDALQDPAALLSPAANHYRFDFSYEGIGEASFPFYRWARVSREVLMEADSACLCQIGDPRGLSSLRQQITRHLAKEHGVYADASLIAILPTARTAVTSCLGLFDRATTLVSPEDSTRAPVARGIRDAGFTLRAHRTQPSPIANPSTELPSRAGKTWIYFSTPAGGFPVGMPLSTKDRKLLLSWASSTGSYIIEDMYGQDFRLKGPKEPALKAHDEDDRVIMLGSFEETLSPSLGIAYLVLPPSLMRRWMEREENAGAVPGWQAQATLARFMEQRLWDGHLRRLQASTREKQCRMENAVHSHLGEFAQRIERRYGLHVPLRLADGLNPGELVERARARGIRIYPAPASAANSAGVRPLIALGYACIPAEDIEPGIRLLADAWNS